MKSSIRQAKLVCLSSLLKQSRKSPQLASRLWPEINHVIGRRASHNSVESKNVSLDILNEHFRSVAISETYQPADSWTLPPDFDTDAAKFCFCPIEVFDIVTQLQHLDVHKSTESNGFSAQFLREVAVEIAEPLTAIIIISHFSLELYHLLGRNIREVMILIPPTSIQYL